MSYGTQWVALLSSSFNNTCLAQCQGAKAPGPGVLHNPFDMPTNLNELWITMCGLASTSPQQLIPSQMIGTEACVVATHALIAKHPEPIMTWDAAMPRLLECCTIF